MTYSVHDFDDGPSLAGGGGPRGRLPLGLIRVGEPISHFSLCTAIAASKTLQWSCFSYLTRP